MTVESVYRTAIPHLYLFIGNERRGAGLLGSFYTGMPARRPLADMLPVDADSVTLWGGEPTLRADLLQLIRALPDCGMLTDGVALGKRAAMRSLRDAGLQRVRIAFPSARSDASDWLTGIAGSARAAVRAIRTAADESVAVEVDVCITRPTVAHLAETVSVVARLPVKRIFLRPAGPSDFRPEHIVMLAPRFAATVPELIKATDIAKSAGIEAVAQGFPRCVLATAIDDLPDDGERVRCRRCPGAPECHGVAASYAATFGCDEFESRAERRDRIEIRIDPTVSSRAIRIEFARLAQERPSVLRIDDAFAHADAAELLRDACRLSIPRIEIAGSAVDIERLSDGEIGHLKGIASFDAIIGPDLNRATRQIERFRALTGVECGVPQTPNQTISGTIPSSSAK